MADESPSTRLRSLDEDHFYFDGVLIDLVMLRHMRDRLNKGVPKGQWRDVHGRNSAVYMLEVYAGGLAGTNHCGDLVTPEKVAKYLKECHAFNLPTGWEEEKQIL